MNNQKGMVTLLTSVVLTVIITLLVFWGARGSIIEQQSANNAYMTQIAFQNAEQGRALLYSNINEHIKNDETSTFSAALSSAKNSTNHTVGAHFSVSYLIDSDGVTATLYSTGISQGGATRKVSQRINFIPGRGIGPAALVSLGNINLGGSTTASSAIAGGTITGNIGSGSSSSAMPNSDEFDVALLDHSGNQLLNSYGNPVSRNMTTDEYFMYYFGSFCPNARRAYATDITKAADCKIEAKESVKNNKHGYVCPGDCSSKNEDKNISNAYDAGRRIFWLSGGGIDHKKDIGTKDEPVLIFVMGIGSGSKAAKINANSTIHGVLYIDVEERSGYVQCGCKGMSSVESINGSGATLSPVSYQLEPNQDAMCTLAACMASTNKCIPSNFGFTATNVGDVVECPFSANAVAGVNDIPVEVEILGDWDAGGSGKATFYGSVISSGNIKVTGNASYIENFKMVADAG